MQLRDRVRSGEELERQVFFTTDPYKLLPDGSQERALLLPAAPFATK